VCQDGTLPCADESKGGVREGGTQPPCRYSDAIAALARRGASVIAVARGIVLAGTARSAGHTRGFDVHELCAAKGRPDALVGPGRAWSQKRKLAEPICPSS
jgi:hypothetical protein